MDKGLRHVIRYALERDRTGLRLPSVPRAAFVRQSKPSHRTIQACKFSTAVWDSSGAFFWRERHIRCQTSSTLLEVSTMVSMENKIVTGSAIVMARSRDRIKFWTCCLAVAARQFDGKAIVHVMTCIPLYSRHSVGFRTSHAIAMTKIADCLHGVLMKHVKLNIRVRMQRESE